MLIHKKSLGVLTTVMAPDADALMEIAATIDNFFKLGLEINPNEWWFVPNSTPLARRINLSYPDFVPVTDDSGELVDIVDLKVEKQKALRAQAQAEEAERAERLRREAEARGYDPRFRKTRVDPQSMSFLQDTLRGRMGDAE